MVNIPTTGGGPQGPTGQVNNNTTAFQLNGRPAIFIFANIGGSIYVTYAPAGHTAQTDAHPGQGTVAVFNTSGAFLKRLISGSRLASPWGLAMAPASFGQFSGDLLVGQRRRRQLRSESTERAG